VRFMHLLVAHKDMTMISMAMVSQLQNKWMGIMNLILPQVLIVRVQLVGSADLKIVVNQLVQSASVKTEKKRKRAKPYYALVQDIICAMNILSETMHFTHVTDPNESIYKAIDDMEYPLPVRLNLLLSLAQNANIASMLKGRPEETIKQGISLISR
jgi:hypothetical protein